MEVGNITNAATFKSSLPLSYEKSLVLWIGLLNILMRQTLTNDFWGLHKNMNCAFPLRKNLHCLLNLYTLSQII